MSLTLRSGAAVAVVEPPIRILEDRMNSLRKNEMYELVELPNGLNSFKNKWVFKIKEMKSR